MGHEVPNELDPEGERTEDIHPERCGSYLRLTDSCITQLKAQGPSRTCNESKEEEEGVTHMGHEVPNELDPEGEREEDIHPEQKRHPENLAGGLGFRVYYFRTTTSQKCEAVPRRARI